MKTIKVLLVVLALVAAVVSWKMMCVSKEALSGARKHLTQAHWLVHQTKESAALDRATAQVMRESADAVESELEKAEATVAKLKAELSAEKAALVAEQTAAARLQQQIAATERHQARKLLQPHMETLSKLPIESRQRMAEKLLRQLATTSP